MASKKIIVIGGGPAGIMAAGMAAVRGKKVILIEKNKTIGKKLSITGKGRCNLTNYIINVGEFIENIPVNGNFMHSALNQFGAKQLMKFFASQDLGTKVERGNRVFPSSERAEDVVETLELFLKRNKVEIVRGDVDQIIVENNAVKGIYLSDDTYHDASSIVIATGGLSYPQTGSTGDGYWFAEHAGHHIVDLKPSLVPLESDDGCCKKMQGLSLKNVGLKVYDQNDNIVYEDFGEMLFTHFGVSGPMILSASSHMRDYQTNQYSISIDFKPALDEETLGKRLQSDFLRAAKNNFSNSLGGLFPAKLIPVMVHRSQIPPDQKCSTITKEQRQYFMSLIKDFRIHITGPCPVDEAIVTSGGVDVKEINPSTMESKLVKGLYFAGEVIDIDGYTGGFNLQIAFSTGYVAGNSVK